MPLTETTPAQPMLGGAQLSFQTEVLSSPGPAVTVLSVAGELDISTCATAATVLEATLAHAPGPVVVDVAGLVFCSAGGLGLLGTPTGTAGGDDYVLAGLSRHLRRITAVFWAADQPVRYTHTAAAVTALRAASV